MSSTYCQLCGRKIKGRGNLIRHPEWRVNQKMRLCQHCIQQKPRCKICGMPMDANIASGICQSCVQFNKICLTCGQQVRDRYWEVDGVGPYCHRCCQERPPCDVCSAPLGDDHWQLSDGRIFCSHCFNTGVFSIEEAQVLYGECKKIILQYFGMELNIPTALVLVDRSQLAEVIKEQSSGEYSLDFEKTMGIYARRGMKRGIYVQTGLPRVLFLQVASHEVAHAWQGENCPLLSEITLREGFAEWVAYQIMGHFGYKDQMARMRARKDIYGRGLEMVLQLELQTDTAGVIEACRNSR